MGQIKTKQHNQVKNGQLQDLQTDCNICALKKMNLCPYLERLVDCHIFNGLKSKMGVKSINKEKRRYRRILTSIPVFVDENGSGKATVHIGSIIDISLGGLRISIPRGMKYKVLAGPRKTEFQIIFTLPGEKEPIQIKCKSRRVVDSKDNLHLGASIIDADLQSYKALADYMM